MMRRAIAAAMAVLAASCSPADEPAPADSGKAGAQQVDTAKESPAPEVFAATAWRSMSEDGARYTTYLDSDGSYRDFRNGDPWQTGAWRYDVNAGSVLCLRPADENGIERCWKPGKMRGETLVVTGDGDRRIELERVEYAPPEDGDDTPA